MRTTRLPDKIKVVQTVVPTAGAAAGMTETEVDGSGFSRVLWVVSTGASATGATIDFKIQYATATGGSFSDVTSAVLVQVLAATGASKTFMIDMPVSPTKPFMIPVGVVGTDTFANSGIAILYRGTRYPIDTTYATQLITLQERMNAYATLAEYKKFVTSRGQTPTTDTNDDAVISILLDSASRFIDVETRRKFYPTIEAHLFDIPSDRHVYLDADLLEVIEFLNGDATAINATNYTLRSSRPPHWCISLKDVSTVAWNFPASGSSEQVLSLNGVWGYHEQYTQRGWAQVGTLSAAITDTTTLAFSATTGHSITAEMIVKIGDEIYNVVTAATNTITPVKRGDNGSTAATHLISAPIYAWQPMEGAKQSCLEIAHSSYERRFGKNTSNTATITAMGVVLSPQDIPATAKMFISSMVNMV